MKKILSALAILFSFAAAASAGEVLFIPPDVFYLAGAEEERATPPGRDEAANLAQCREYGNDKWRLILDELGRSAYLAMSDAVATFNASPEALRNRRHYRAQSMAYPSCRNNLKIKKFYRGLGEPGTPLLQDIKGKNGLEAIIWTDFRSRDVLACLSGLREECTVTADVNLYDGSGVRSVQIEQTFSRKHQKFTADSLDGLSREVARLLTRVGVSE